MKGVSIDVTDLCVSYGGEPVLNGIDLSIVPGEFIALLGASGCGKTTLLRTLAGFIRAGRGDIRVAGQSIVHLPPEKRNMAMMFQSYALWPHMTVAQNIGFALRLRKLSKEQIRSQTEKMLQLVGLEGFASRNVGNLSGGQRQRVALARALAVDPPILLLDEPLSNLDARIRLSMRHEIKSLQSQLGLTTMHVTHDREEAMAMADRVVILNQGRVEQVGHPEDVFLRPQSSFVASFMGAENIYPVHVRRDDTDIVISGAQAKAQVTLPIASHDRDGVNFRLSQNGPAAAHFRSESAFIPTQDDQDTNCLSLNGYVKQHIYLGNVYRHTVSVGEHDFLVDHPNRIDMNATVDVCIPAAALHVFEANSATADLAGEHEAQPTKRMENVA